MKIGKIWTITLLACFIFVRSASAQSEARRVYFVVNAHGGKATSAFTLPASLSVYSPAALSHSYSYEDDGADPKGVENIFATGRLPAYKSKPISETWQKYTASQGGLVPEVVLTPLNFDKNLVATETGVTRELKYLRENMNHESNHWAYDTGPDAVLIVRRANGIEKIVGHQEVKHYMDDYDVPAAKYTQLDAPIILLVPKQNKVKVLARTSLSEVVALLHQIFEKQSDIQIHLLMAACNEESTPSGKSVVLSTDAAKAKLISFFFPD